MEHLARQNLTGGQTSSLRRSLLVLLALTYLFVGFAHTVVCVDQAVAATGVLHAESAPDKADTGVKHAAATADHCDLCAPSQAATAVVLATPSDELVSLDYPAASLPHLLQVQLDTPPPKP